MQELLDFEEFKYHYQHNHLEEQQKEPEIDQHPDVFDDDNIEDDTLVNIPVTCKIEEPTPKKKKIERLPKASKKKNLEATEDVVKAEETLAVIHGPL